MCVIANSFNDQYLLSHDGILRHSCPFEEIGMPLKFCESNEVAIDNHIWIHCYLLCRISGMSKECNECNG